MCTWNQLENFSEYIVNFDFFLDEMKKIGMELVNPKMKLQYQTIFKSKYMDERGIGSLENVIQDIQEIQKDKYFKNFYSRASMIQDNPSVAKLSSLNNYFIFRKK